MFLSFIYIKMKISQREIKLISEAIVNQVYDETKINEQINKEQEKAWKKFTASKKWKDTLKLLEQWRKLDWFESITVKDKKFFNIEGMCWMYDYKITDEDKVKNSYFVWIASSIRRKFPDRYTVLKRIETLLTIKALCWKDMESIMNDIINTVKWEYKL